MGMDSKVIIIGSFALSIILGFTLVISGSLFHVKISSTYDLLSSQCYHAANPEPSVENLCLHFLVWKTSALLGIIFGFLHIFFGLAAVIVTYIYQIREAPPWDRRKVMDDYIAHDCQIIWLGYHLLTMLLFTYVFYVLLNTKADSSELEEDEGELRVVALVYISFVGVEMILLSLGLLLVLLLVIYFILDFTGFQLCTPRAQHGNVYYY